MWDDSDEDWLIFDAEPVTMDDAAESTANGEERPDPVPDGEASTERDDEG